MNRGKEPTITAELATVLEAIDDVDSAASQALNKVKRRRNSIMMLGGCSIHSRGSAGSTNSNGNSGRRGSLVKLSAATRRASLLGRMTSVRDLDMSYSARERMPEEYEDFSFNEEEEYEDEEEQQPRTSILSLPEFELACDLLNEKGIDPANASGSADLGTQRFFAKMKDFAPHSFDVMGEKKVLLGVSLGSQNTELARLDAMLQFICANFEECTIMPGDYIYRLTLQLKYGLDDRSAEEEAIHAQQDYMAMCTTVLAQYTGMCRFHWRPMSDVVNKHSDEYKDSYATMKRLYENNKEFRESVKGFSQNYITRIDKDDAAEAAVVSIRYLLEECAILNCMALENPTTMVYAGSIQSVRDICAGKFEDVPQAMKHNLRFVEVAVSPRGKFFPSGERKVLKIGELTVGSVDRPSFSTSLKLDDETMRKLIKVSREARPKVGTLLVTADKPCHELIIIRKGRAEELLKRQDGSLQRLAVLEKGSIVGADGFFDGSESPVTVNTLETCECSKITRKAFDSLVEKDPQLVITLLKEVARLQSGRARLLMYELQNMRL